MNKTIAELTSECQLRGIKLDPYEKYSRDGLISLIQKQSLETYGPLGYGLEKRLQMKSPMLCFNFKDLHESEQEEYLRDGNEWIGEEKFNGCRMIPTYHPDEGFRFFGRELSVEDFLPIEYTRKILFIKDKEMREAQKFTLPQDIIPNLPAFVLDEEITTELGEGGLDTRNFTGTGTQIWSELNAAVSLLSQDQRSSHIAQIEQAHLQFKVFDLLWYEEEDFRGKPFLLRKKKLLEVTQMLKACTTMDITLSQMYSRRKRELFEEFIEKKGEGIVLKRLDQEYVSTTSRKRTSWVKMKRGMSGSLSTHGEDIDAFIIGSVPATEGKAWEKFIGGLKFGVYLRDTLGEIQKHHIATITGLPMDIREQMTSYVNGEPCLKKEWLGRIFTINGQSVTKKSLRFAHASIDWGSQPQREDKTKADCVMEEAFLLEQTM